MRTVILFKPSVDHVFYARGMFGEPNDKLNIKIANLDDKISFDDIESSKYSGSKKYSSDDLYLFEKDKSYVIDFDYKNTFDQLILFLNPVEIEENIEIYENETNYLYL